MDAQQVQYFKQIVECIDKDSLFNINAEWEDICSHFNIDTSVHPPKDHNGAKVVCN